MHMAMSFFFGLQRPLLFSTWNLNNAGGIKITARNRILCVISMISHFRDGWSDHCGANLGHPLRATEDVS